jgi:hypothetical protein
MTDQPDPLGAARHDTEIRLALQQREMFGARIQRAVDAGIIDSPTGLALLDFWYPVP